MLLAISPNKQPILVAPAADKTWGWNHDYYCVAPYYVQFVSDEEGRVWTWPPEIEHWLYELPHNLMLHRPSLGELRNRYTAEQRNKADETVSIQSPSRTKIDPNYSTTDCKRKI